MLFLFCLDYYIFQKAKKPRAPKGPKLPAPFASGTILQDLKKKQWKLGNEVGKGGFGLIYLGKGFELSFEL